MLLNDVVLGCVVKMTTGDENLIQVRISSVWIGRVSHAIIATGGVRLSCGPTWGRLEL